MSNNPNDYNFDDDPFGDDPFGDTPASSGASGGDAFDFDNAFGFDDDEQPQFDFGDETAVTGGLGDSFDPDMPVIVDRTDEGGTSRTFVLLAVLMILMFVAGLALVAALVLRPTGPSDAELTATRVVQLNSTVEAQIAQTQTQGAFVLGLTQTFEAYTDTPTLTPSITPTVENTRLPSRTPTPTLDPTELAGTQNALALAMTATALARPTNTATTGPNTPTNTSEPVSLLDSFRTQVAFATEQGIAAANYFATQDALVNAGLDAGSALEDFQATQAAINQNAPEAATAAVVIRTELAEFAQTVAPFATELAILTPQAQATQAALDGLIANATLSAGQTQAAIDSILAGTPGAPRLNAVAIPRAIFQLTPTPTPSPTATATIASVEEVEAQLTQFFGPTLEALETSQSLATQQAQATQSGLATLEYLIQQVLGTIVATPSTPTGVPISAINQTATAIAEAFQIATLQAQPTIDLSVTPGGTPGFPTAVPTATGLPDTGVFDEVSGGGGIGVLALLVVGLVGVVVIARWLRRDSDTETDETDSQDKTP
jgi:hypothetical protein